VTTSAAGINVRATTSIASIDVT